MKQYNPGALQVLYLKSTVGLMMSDRRRKIYIKAREATKLVKLPIKIGNTTVKDLGALLVEDGASQPAFHNANSLWPIGYNATYRDPATSIEYDCRIMDGLDSEFAKSSPVFVIFVQSSTPFVAQGLTEREAWQNVRQKQLVDGTPKEREVAMNWDDIALDQRFGLQDQKLKKMLEGLCGSFDCFCYKYLDSEDVGELGQSRADPSSVDHRGGKRPNSSPNVRSIRQKVEKEMNSSRAASRKRGSVEQSVPKFEKETRPSSAESAKLAVKQTPQTRAPNRKLEDKLKGRRRSSLDMDSALEDTSECKMANLNSGPNAPCLPEENMSPSPTNDAPLRVSNHDRNGQHSVKLAPLPVGSPPTFQKACSAEFLALCAFLEDFGSLLEIDKLSFESAEALLTDLDAKGFSALALKLTRVAVRSKFMREADDSEKDMHAGGVRKLSHILHDLKLAPGPLLSAEMKDSETVAYSCWHLMNECSWPAIALMLLELSLDRVRQSDLLGALAASEPCNYPFNVKVALLSFLCDEICGSDVVRIFLSHKLQQADRLQERKRKEDAAMKKIQDLPSTKNKLHSADSKLKAVNGVEGEGAKDGRKIASVDMDVSAARGKAIDALELMKILFDRDPQHFEIRHKGKVIHGLLDVSSLITKIRCEGQVDSCHVLVCITLRG